VDAKCDSEPGPPAVPRPVLAATGVRRRLYLAAGLAFVGLAAAGTVLPVLPTTPFALVASYCFARSSPRLERWLRRTPLFGPLIRDWEAHRGIRPRAKAVAVAMVVVVIGLTVAFADAPVWAKWSAAGLGAVGVGVILFAVPTVREKR
jgi:uncharacterized membrane protein YbaN (DUF454 family)